ncbi:hypothetical protein B0W47_11475 [Komagataeibacter nataicola]|uniref:Uncharacterized protein n=1 Tax=Komagataeibacter nataicola TaxID=265960 RepID=A0A9N7C982_9PROT|nr:hypothetical protein [Komagataeibacter nataicola]AQU87988.1 hypothetical protein B0W47_11475 [Komagataeibacter nataicola]PYD65897.1 hypothetical protein CDI09_10980 [Komagataeibacter nataicola]WEQ55117.1 hypothetical protein LV564_13525 [Komagataeibacter nataicola]WNM09970.1 hypothetical protein RI056_09125 [Komagataeibacter nataicola]GBR18443.1 hypothetical protein AA0616_1297 [Komagataeibacter nataicola NRIC 0616]
MSGAHAPPAVWPQRDGTPVSCRDKLLVLQENHAEVQGILQDAFEDAVLMGVDEAAMRQILIEVVNTLRSPHA